jgi:imidazolonepropionase
VTPGFVDAHTHLVFAGNRAAEFEQRIAGASYQQIAASGGGILRTVAMTRGASENELLACARRHRDWMLRSGTTTLEAKSGYGLDRKTELKMLRVLRRLSAEGPVRIVPTLLAAHTCPPEFAGRRDKYVQFVATRFATIMLLLWTNAARCSRRRAATAWACGFMRSSLGRERARRWRRSWARLRPIIWRRRMPLH